MCGQRETAILVRCLIWAPFWAVMTVGISSGCLHRFPFAASAEFGPIGRSRLKTETGASGIAAKVEVVTFLRMFVLPTRITRTPPSVEHEVEVGERGAAV